MKQVKKLQLNKEIVAKLRKDEIQNVFGGVEMTGAPTQGPGCQSATPRCVAFMTDPTYPNPVSSYCASGFFPTCFDMSPSCGTDFLCP